jgi:hypothetical protein
MTALLRLYPQDWRDRYGDEFLALLESKPPDLLDRVDIVRGAVDARLHPQRRSGGVHDPADAPGRTSDRLVGAGVLLGGAILLTGVVVAVNGPMVTTEDGTYRDGAGGAPFFAAAVLLLAIGALRTAFRLPSTAEGGRGGAVLVAVFGVWWSLMPWLIPLWVLASIGIVALAAAARRHRVWSRLDTLLVVGGLVVSWAFAVVGLFGLFDLGADAFGLFFITMAAIWLGVGMGLMRQAPAWQAAR